MIKAAFSETGVIYAVAVCKNRAHMDLIMDNLRAYAQTKGLVNMTVDAPQKAADLVAYEASLAAQANTTNNPIVVPPLPPPVPGADTSSAAGAAGGSGGTTGSAQTAAVAGGAAGSAGGAATSAQTTAGAVKSLFAFGTSAV